MTTSTTFDTYLARVNAGERLPAEDIHALASTPDILPLGMLADTLRRRLHDGTVTYLRVASCAIDASFTQGVSVSAREIHITGAPETLEVATTAIAAAKSVAGTRTVSAFSWQDVERLATQDHARVRRVLEELRAAGLDAIADLSIDTIGDVAHAIGALQAAGFQQLCLGVERLAASERTALLVRVAALQDEFACIQAINPLPTSLNPMRPTTGYEDVKMVAIARLAAANVPTIQIDWLRYGP
jgi:aminodeoxyfutalosine synthase